MAFFSSWVHGSNVRPEWVHDNLQPVRGATWDSNNEDRDVPWSDVNGLPRGWGATFRGKRSFSGGLFGASTIGPFDPADPYRDNQKGYWFHFSIPTPVIVFDVRSKLLRVFVLWDASDHVSVDVVHVYDGPSRIAVFGVNPASGSHCGAGGHADLVDGVTKFDLSPAPDVLWGIGVSVGVSFQQDGDITFCSAGADFEV